MRIRRSEGFKRRNIFNISSIESLGPTQKMGLRGGFETASNYDLQGIDLFAFVGILCSLS